MADYRWRTDARTLCYGLGSDLAFRVNPTRGWTSVDGTGAQTFDYTASFVNSYGMGNQNIYCDVHTTWSVNYDQNNRMRVTVTQAVNRVNAYSGNSGINYPYFLLFRNANQGGNQIGGTIWYGLSDSFSRTGIGQQSFTWTVDPHTDSEFNTLYICNVSTTGGHTENDCDAYVDKGTIGIQFHNSRDWIYDRPSFTYKSCRADSTGGRFHITVDYGAVRPGGQDRVTLEVAKDAQFTEIVHTASSSSSDRVFYVTGLQPNTRYYARYTATNGDKSASTTCEFVTMAFNSLSDPASDRFDRGSVRLAVQNGGGVYEPSTSVYYRPCSGGEWTLVRTTRTKTVATINITGLNEQTCYEVQARTTTEAGTYYGNIVNFTTPERNVAHAYFTEIDPTIEPGDPTATAHICYKYDSNVTPFKVRMYYRVKNGFDQSWQYTDDVTFNELEGTYCFDLEGLFPNQTVYEAYLRTETDQAIWNGAITEFTTPLMDAPDNCNCDNFKYLLDLICQAVKPLYSGNKTIYANPTSKELCDPYSDNPTLATLWSRILRFDHAAACLLCDALYLNKVKGGAPDQYYIGELGWQTLIHSVDGIVEDSEILVDSATIQQYIAEKMHEVWHFHSVEDYLVGTVAELPDNVPADTSAIITETSERYVFDGTDWVQDEEFEVDNFAVFHIDNAYESSYGDVKAHSAYYYFEGSWNNLDADTKELEDRVTFLENQLVVLKQSDNEPNIFFQTNDASFNYATLPSGQRVVAFVEEDPNAPVTVYRVVTFDSNGGSDVAPAIVVDGATVSAPANPTRTGANFNEWQLNGSTYDFSQPVQQDLTLVADWTLQTFTVTFAPDGGTMTDPLTQTVQYGSTAVAPSDPVKQDYDFVAWTLNGAVYDFSTPVTGNITLTATYSIKTFNVNFDPNNGSAATVVSVPINTTVTRPADPTRTGYRFLGWYDTNDVIFDFTSPITADTYLTAKWELIVWTITFNTDGGGNIPSQAVADGGLAVKPADPSKTGYTFVEWRINGSPVDFSSPIHNNYTYTAYYEQIMLTVGFDSDGGSAVQSQSVAYGSTATAPVAPIKAGYNFVEWQLDDVTYNFSTPVTDNILLTAVWTPVVWTVTFDADGGSPAPAAQNVQNGNTATRPATDPSKAGYSFSEWVSGGAAYDFNTPVFSDVYIQAAYLPIYTVTFDSNGGSSVQSQEVVERQTATEPTAPTKHGHTFDGWFLSGSLYDFSTPVLSNLTLLAEWTPVYVTVTFDSNGGSAVPSSTIYSGDTVTQPADPTRYGYAFDGWTLNGVAYNFATPVTEDITLVANWTQITVNITITDSANNTTTVTANYGDTVSEPTWADQATQYIKTWTDSADSSAVTFPLTVSDSNTHATADPVVRTLTITGDGYVNKAHATFDANGGTPTPADQYKKGGEKLDEPTQPTKSGYYFDGWEKQ